MLTTSMLMNYFWIGFASGFIAFPFVIVLGIIIGEYLSRKNTKW